MTFPSPVRTSAGPLRNLGAALLVATLLVGTAPAIAGEPSHLTVSAKSMGATQVVALEVNKSLLVDLPTNATEVIVSQPTVANAIMRTKTRAIVQGMAGGDTNIVFLGANGATIATLDIKVYQPRSDVGNALQAALARTLPGSRINVESVILGGTTNRVVLSGTALSQDDVSKATLIAVQFAGAPENVANIVTVSGNQQVMLRVTVAEVDRTAIKQLGLDLSASASGGLITSLVNTPSGALGGSSGVSAGQGSITGNASIGPLSITATLKALERRSAVRTLAEPTLTAMSGQSAEFLAGGQRAIITTDSAGNQVINYKDYGVKLNFTPTVKSNGQVDLLVETSVSEPIGTNDFSTRSAKTTVEIPSGSTLAIGGLIQDEVKQQISGMPGLGNIPILGALFRSRDFIHNQTELMVLVTPVLATTGRPELPTDSYVVAGDAEAVFLGHLEKMYGVGDNAGMRGSYNGSVGFVLD